MNSQLIAFIDTNALLHYPPIADVDWCKVCGVDAVTIMLCLPVIKELDRKKADAALGSRAKSRIKEIELSLHTEVRPGVKVQVYNHPLKSAEFSETLSIEEPDDQIVHFAIMYGNQHGTEIAIITEDLGMKLRCRAHAVRIIEPPDNRRLDDPQSAEKKQIQQLQRELLDLKNRRPRLTVIFFPDVIEVLPLQLPDVGTQLREIERQVVDSRPLGSTVRTQFTAFSETRLRPYLENEHRIAEESARSIIITPTLYNEGSAPAKTVDVTFKFPKQIQAICFDFQISGPRTKPTHLGREVFRVTLPERVKPLPAELGLEARPPVRGTVHNNEFHHNFHLLPHDDKLKFPPFALTFDTWSNIGNFAIEVKIRVQDPPELFQFRVPIKVTLKQ